MYLSYCVKRKYTVSMTAKDFVKTNMTPVENNRKASDLICDMQHEAYKLGYGKSLLSDNRKVFASLFGKPHFYYKGSFNFHCWSFTFEGETFVVLTAKEKGTCIEIQSDWETVRGNTKTKVVISFLNMLNCKLKEYYKKEIGTWLRNKNLQQ